MVEEVQQQKTPEETAQEILATNPSTETAEQPAEPQVDAPAPVAESPDPLSVVKDFLGKEQGRLAQVSGQRIAAVEKSLKTELDDFKQSIQPLLEQAESAKREQLLSMGQDELAEMVIEQQRNAATAQAPQQDPYLTALATASQELITENNLNISHEDPNIWTGWQKNMSVTQSIELARQNIERMSGKTVAAPVQETPVTQQTPAQQAPPATPSTQGAPQKSIKTISTLSEAAQLFADGNIDTAQYRSAKKQISQGGSATL